MHNELYHGSVWFMIKGFIEMSDSQSIMGNSYEHLLVRVNGSDSFFIETGEVLLKDSEDP